MVVVNFANSDRGAQKVPPHNTTPSSPSPQQMPSSRDAKVQLSHGELALLPRILARGISRASTHRSSRQSPNLKTAIHPSVLHPPAAVRAAVGGHAINVNVCVFFDMAFLESARPCAEGETRLGVS